MDPDSSSMCLCVPWREASARGWRGEVGTCACGSFGVSNSVCICGNVHYGGMLKLADELAEAALPAAIQ